MVEYNLVMFHMSEEPYDTQQFQKIESKFLIKICPFKIEVRPDGIKETQSFLILSRISIPVCLPPNENDPRNHEKDHVPVANYHEQRQK